MSLQALKFDDVIVARPFILVSYETSGKEVVGIKERRETVRGEKLKLERVFAREMVSAQKAVPAGSEAAAEILAEVAAAKPAKAAKADAQAGA